MSVLEYKGYQASVTWEDDSIFVRVLHVDDLLLAECDDAKEVVKTFHDLVDDYLETCEELGREPKKPFKGTFNVRISPALHRAAVMAATKSDISLNAWVAEAIEEKISRDNEGSEKHSAIPDFDKVH